MDDKIIKLQQLFELCLVKHYMATQEENLSRVNKIFDLIDANFSEPGFVQEKLNKTDRMHHINILVDRFSKNYGEVNFKPFQKPDNTYGLCAKSKIDPGTFVTVPYEEIICVQKFRKETEYQPIFHCELIKRMDNVLLAFISLLEFYKQEKSEYHDYLMSLPSTFGNIVEFDREKFRLISYTDNFSEWSNTWVSLVRVYSYLHTCIINWVSHGPYEIKKLLKSNNVDKKFCLKDYMWAVGIVMTRNFPYKFKGVNWNCLVPIIDLCNHHRNAVFPYTSENPTKFYGETNSMIMGGEEIFIKYSGDLKDFDSLFVHGFVDSLNEHKFATLVFPYRSADKSSNIKHQFMLKYTQSSTCLLKILEKDWWPGNNSLRLRIFAANTEELNFFRGLSKNEFESLLTSDKAYNQRNENMCFILLARKFKEVIANLEKLDEITGLPQSQFVKYLKMAAMSEKRVLLLALNWLIDTFPEFAKIYD